MSTLLISSLLPAYADFPAIPLDKSDNQSPALISATLEKTSAPASSANSIILTILDDKNSMRVGSYEMEAPAGTGTAYLNEGYSQIIAPPVLLNQKQTDQGIEQTWKLSFKVPSVLGKWNGYRVDFSDLVNNSVQFIIKDHSACLNSKRYKYPNQAAGSLDAIPCTFNLDLNVTAEDPSQLAKVTSPELEVAKKNLIDAQAELRIAISKVQELPIYKNNQNLEKSYKYFLDFATEDLNPGMEVNMILPARIQQLSAMTKQIQGITSKLANQYLVESKKTLSITCLKSGKKIVVSGRQPKCPIGYKISK